jgi:hypothetical protein
MSQCVQGHTSDRRYAKQWCADEEQRRLSAQPAPTYVAYGPQYLAPTTVTGPTTVNNNINVLAHSEDEQYGETSLCLCS